MKKFIQIVGAIFLLALFLHGVVWILDRDLYAEKRRERHSFDPRQLKTIKEIRISLERNQKKEINSYGWSDKTKARARIPVRRAFSYYIKSLSH